MHEALALTQDPNWVLSHEGYHVQTESAVESRFAVSNGFLGVRAARAVSRGPTWVSWLGYIKWASWPRCYVAGLFDRPNTEPPVPALVPVADWPRVRIVLNGQSQLLSDGEIVSGVRKLDMRRGVFVAELALRLPAGLTVSGKELRLVSLADRAVGLQLLQFALDRDGVDVRLEATFPMSGLGMEPVRLEPDLGSWRAEGTDKGVAMAGDATLRVGGTELVPDRPFSLRWVWQWRSVAGQMVGLTRLVAVARADTRQDDPAPAAAKALAHSRALGWRAVLAAHQAAWQERWLAGDVVIEGGDGLQRALRFAVYHLISAANPNDETVSVGARALIPTARIFGSLGILKRRRL
jgi:trehalose/maltose hydrolase-like predicted phosphorylase